MIRLDNVTKIYYNKGVVSTGISKVSLNFDIGEFVVIVGESGSGKSTLLNVISGLDTYEEGEMYVNGLETSYYGEDERNEYRRKYIANIFQAFNLINSYTVKQNVELALIINGSSLKENKKRVNEVLKQVGLWKYRHRRVTKLSGGQKQRVAIARALVQETPIIVCDEPTGNLDSAGAKDIFKLLKTISKEKLVIVVTHNFDQVSEYATRVVKMHDGKVLEDNEIEKVNEDKDLVIVNHKPMNLLSRIRLAFRNAFSTFIKLFLCTSVFAIITFILISIMGNNENTLYNDYSNNVSDFFNYADPTRIILNKKDGSSFSEEELNNLKNINYVSSINNNDIYLDSEAYFQNDFIMIDGFINDKTEIPEVKMYKGRMPESDNEALVVVGKESYYLEDYYVEPMFENQEFTLLDEYTYEVTDTKVQIVGIAIQDDCIFSSTPTIYVSSDVVNIFNNLIQDRRNSFTFKINNNTLDVNEGYQIKYSDKVPVGTAIVSSSVTPYCQYEYCVGKTLTITNKTKYYTKEVDFKINKVFDNYNFKSIFGVNMNSDEYYYGNIYLNPADKSLFISNDIYQISLFVSDAKYVNDVDSLIDSNIYNHIALQNTKESVNDLIKMARYFKIIGFVIAIIVVLVISYLVIYIILKSRITYYAVIRMLGGTIKDNRKLVYLELLIYANLGFIIVALICSLTKYGILNIGFLYTLLQHLNLLYMLGAYVILIIMSIFISYKFTKKIFKSSMISTYNMEV